MLPDSPVLLVFVLASLAIYVSPGPDMLYIASRSIARGRRAGVISALGTSTGLLAHTLGVALGLSALLVVWPLAFLAVKWLGVAYLVFLGVQALLQGGGRAPDLEPGNGEKDAWRLYRQGLTINLLNPKIALFFLAFLPQFATGEGSPVALQMFLLGALFTAGGTLWTLSLAIVFGAVGGWLARHPLVWIWQRRFTGTVLLGMAANLALSERD